MGHRLVARRLGAQFSKSQGFALQLITESANLAAERFEFFRADRVRAREIRP
jgi:hypothetical protein